MFCEPAAVRGLGIAYGPIDFFRDDLDDGKLRPVLPAYQLPEATIYAVYPASRQLSAKVKVFNEFMTRFFAASAIFRRDTPVFAAQPGDHFCGVLVRREHRIERPSRLCRRR